MPTHYDFSNRSGVVTGGAQGFGRAVVERLIGGGAAIAIWDRDTALAEKTAKELAGRGKVIAIGADVTDYASIERARDETIKALGRIDILVNNAGIAGRSPSCGSTLPRTGMTCCASISPDRSTAARPSFRA